MDAPDTTVAGMVTPRSLVCHYNPTIVAAALGVSLLGALTSTQLMNQARSARTLKGALIWTILGCLTFGFCGVWCLHFLCMLSCEFDLPIGLNPLLTILSAFLAVSFTFGAMSTDLVQKYRRQSMQRDRDLERPFTAVDRHLGPELDGRQSIEPLLRPMLESMPNSIHKHVVRPRGDGWSSLSPDAEHAQGGSSSTETLLPDIEAAPEQQGSALMSRKVGDHVKRTPLMSEYSQGLHRDSVTPTNLLKSPSMLDNTYHELDIDDTSDDQLPNSSTTARNLFIATFQTLLGGFTFTNVIKGFIWSLALTTMHFMGMKALEVPGGFVDLNALRVILCEAVSWSVCSVCVILMPGMECNLPQQILFSVVAATGVGAVHFSGMYACSFWSIEEPSPNRGYPVELPVAIGCVAILTCMASTGLLAHSATVARDKLVDVLYTRRRLWAAITQKENAEAAAAAKGEFIASASHEIRTPLHQLQGYADLLARSELSEEDRRLLQAIQLATRSLAMITSNVLDWSRLESGEAVCRIAEVDIRTVVEAVTYLLPNSDDNIETELLVVVSPEVPRSVLLDETYLQRILMNLLSNSFKFTRSGYVMLLIRLRDDVLHITVQDSGCGIPDDFLPQLFEPYKQVQVRGAERGTGLGLSITKRLLERMGGRIVVESKHQQNQSAVNVDSGSVFKLTIPMSNTIGYSDHLCPNPLRGTRIVIMHDGITRSIEGLSVAWKLFGAEVSHATTDADLMSDDKAVVWVDLTLLQKYRKTLGQIIGLQQPIVVPYHDRAALDGILGTARPANIIPIRKPLIWHHIVMAIANVKNGREPPKLDKDAISLPVTSVLADPANCNINETIRAIKGTVLLVEDNKINPRLGAKMLKTLNYDVLLAEDGQEAVDIVLEHSHAINVILMDQSMPRKDGITATREIRGLEAAGRLARRQIIIAVTAAAGPQDQALFLKAGSDMFLSKPLSLAKLEQSLSHYFDE